jgi:hypothetical protein
MIVLGLPDLLLKISDMPFWVFSGGGYFGNKTCRFSTINRKAHSLVMALQVISLRIILISYNFLVFKSGYCPKSFLSNIVCAFFTICV